MTAFLPVMGLVAGGLQAAGALQESGAQAKAAQRNAEIARQEQEGIRRSADLDIERQRRQARALTGRQRVLYAKAGVTLDSGSPLEVMTDSLAQAELDMMITDYNAKLGITQKENEARMQEYQAREYRRAGTMRAGTTLLTSAYNYGTQYLKNTQKPTQAPRKPGRVERNARVYNPELFNWGLG